METKLIYQGAADLKQYHLRLPSKLHTWLKSEAERNGRSMALEIAEALEAWQKLKENDEDENNE